MQYISQTFLDKKMDGGPSHYIHPCVLRYEGNQLVANQFFRFGGNRKMVQIFEQLEKSINLKKIVLLQKLAQNRELFDHTPRCIYKP